jgi:phosphoglycolate phosphatase-like HAD superfamily hydrolase
LNGTLVDSVYQHVLAWREALEQLGIELSVWRMLAARRARALGVGLLSGGYGGEELERAGAYRVYQDPSDLLNHLDEVGVRP